jgi:hypothetical protein
MEVTQEIIQGMVETFSDELEEEGIDGGDILSGASTYLPTLQQVGTGVFQRWAGLLNSAQP